MGHFDQSFLNFPSAVPIFFFSRISFQFFSVQEPFEEKCLAFMRAFSALRVQEWRKIKISQKKVAACDQGHLFFPPRLTHVEHNDDGKLYILRVEQTVSK